MCSGIFHQYILSNYQIIKVEKKEAILDSLFERLPISQSKPDDEGCPFYLSALLGWPRGVIVRGGACEVDIGRVRAAY